MGFRLRPPSRIGGHASLHGETKLKIRNLKEKIMPIIAWLLGVPLSVVLLLMLFGVF